MEVDVVEGEPDEKHVVSVVVGDAMSSAELVLKLRSLNAFELLRTLAGALITDVTHPSLSMTVPILLVSSSRVVLWILNSGW